MIWWYWTLFGLALLILELFLPSGFFIFFFGVGALITSMVVAAGIGLSAGAQWLFCSVLSVLLALFFRRYLMGEWESANSFSNSPEGREVIILEPAAHGENGACEFRGSRWNFRNVGSENLQNGDRAIVESREGITLLIKKI